MHPIHNEVEAPPPTTRFFIDQKCWDKIIGWARAAGNLECSGLGFVRQDGFQYIIEEVFLLKQICSGSYTLLEDEYYGKFGSDLIMNRLEDIKKYKGIRLWWHSHVDMPIFWSGTDLATIQRHCCSGNKNAWGMALVVNKREEYRLLYDFPSMGIRLDQQNLEVIHQPDIELQEQCKREVAEMVHSYDNFEIEIIRKGEASIERIVEKKKIVFPTRSLDEYYLGKGLALEALCGKTVVRESCLNPIGFLEAPSIDTLEMEEITHG